MKSTKLGTRALAGFLAVVMSGLIAAGIDGLASHYGTAAGNNQIARSVPEMHKGAAVWKKT